MKEALVAKRYADAFMSWTKNTIGREAAIQDVKNLGRVIFDNPEFFDFLVNPGFTASEKETLVSRSLGSGFSGEMIVFLKLLIAKRRADILPWVIDYVRERYAHGEAVTAVLKSSYPLDLDIMAEIKTKLEGKLHKKLAMYTELDPDLKGGVQIMIGNTLIDGSIRHRLSDIKDKLKASGAGYHGD